MAKVFSPKIFNDPVYGFITISDPLIQQLLDHPWFQRLGRIAQGGMTYLVYPGAQHTRFHHALGATYLMEQALNALERKGTEISKEERQAALAAILLHDLGHGPYSHTLEGSIMPGVHHERLSLQMMQRLNEEFHQSLDLAIAIFKGEYPRTFFNQLVSSQLDVDRLDYLMRDSFYTGVAEGIIGSERIIKMMRVVDDKLVIEEKGIYSVEKFLIARRLMYWQVYLHKTVLGAEAMLHEIFRRARHVVLEDPNLFGTPALRGLLYAKGQEHSSDDLLDWFTQLDDTDVMASIKVWSNHKDPVLSDLCQRILHRRLFKIRLQVPEIPEDFVHECRKKSAQVLGLSPEDTTYFVQTGSVANQGYDTSKGEIEIYMKSGKLLNFFEASDNLAPENLSKKVVKHYVCFPKEILPLDIWPQAH